MKDATGLAEPERVLLRTAVEKEKEISRPNGKIIYDAKRKLWKLGTARDLRQTRKY